MREGGLTLLTHRSGKPSGWSRGRSSCSDLRARCAFITFDDLSACHRKHIHTHHQSIAL